MRGERSRVQEKGEEDYDAPLATVNVVTERDVEDLADDVMSMLIRQHA